MRYIWVYILNTEHCSLYTKYCTHCTLYTLLSKHYTLKARRILPWLSVTQCGEDQWLSHLVLYTVKCSLCITVFCTLYTVYFTLFTVHCTLYQAHCAHYTGYSTLCTVHCARYTVHSILHIVHCTLYYIIERGGHRIILSYPVKPPKITASFSVLCRGLVSNRVYTVDLLPVQWGCG